MVSGPQWTIYGLRLPSAINLPALTLVASQFVELRDVDRDGGKSSCPAVSVPLTSHSQVSHLAKTCSLNLKKKALMSGQRSDVGEQHLLLLVHGADLL